MAKLESSKTTGLPELLNRRPKEVTALLLEPDVHPGWFIANKGQNRFFVVNLAYVMGVIGIDYTRTRPYFEMATQIILGETEWPKTYSFAYTSSHTQLRPEKRNEPKQFGHAVAIIVAMEVAAHEKAPAFNVYDWLRILPAQYFVDRFDEKRLEALRLEYTEMSERERIEKFGDAASTESFDGLVLRRIDQEFSVHLVDQIVDGYCITKFTADQIVEFVNANFSSHLHVGPVLSSGEDSVSRRLGIKRAAPDLRVPRILDQENLKKYY